MHFKWYVLRVVEAKLCLYLILVFWPDQHLGDGLAFSFMLTSPPQLLSVTYHSKSLLSQNSKSEEGGLHKNVNSDMTVSYINPQASHLKGCWGLTCISLSGGRSIPTEEFVPPSKFLVNSWPKSKFSWSKQLLVSNIQKISLKRRDQIKAIRQNKMLHYSMSAEAFQKLKITVMFAAKSLGNWQGAHSCIPWAPWHFDIFITLRFQQIPHFLPVLWTEDFKSIGRSVTVSMKVLIMKTHETTYY